MDKIDVISRRLNIINKQKPFLCLILAVLTPFRRCCHRICRRTVSGYAEGDEDEYVLAQKALTSRAI